MAWTTAGLDALGDAAAVLAALRPESAPAAIAPALRFEHINDVGAFGMGADVQQLVGRCLHEIAPGLVGVADWRHVADVALTGTPDSWLSHHDGSWHELRAAPITPPDDLVPAPDVLRYILVSSRSVAGRVLTPDEGEHVSRQAGLLLQVSRRLGGAVTEADVAQIVLDIVTPAIGGLQGTLAILRPDGDLETVTRAPGDPPDVQRRELVPGDGDSHLARVTRSGVQVVAMEPAPSLTVPLHVGRTTLGALQVTLNGTPDDAASGVPPGGAEAVTARQEYIDTVATLVAQAVRRAGLYETALQSNLALQHALLPPGLPDVAGAEVAVRYLPGSGEEVGGDWYDVVQLGNGSSAFVIGDVEGHDLAAAALMGQIRSVVRAYLLDLQPPTTVLSGANAFLLSLGADRLVTACIVLTHASARLVTVATAGHACPIIVPATGEVTLFPLDVGPPLGTVEENLCRERTLLLPAQSQLALYTDGLIERRSRSYVDGENELLAGLDALPDRGSMSAEQLADALLTLAGMSVHTSSPGVSDDLAAEDDTALLTVRWVGQDDGPQRQSRYLPVARESAVIARWFAADLLAGWGEASECIETVVLLTDELVANAVRHAHRMIRLTVALQPETVRIDVFDDSHREPRLVEHDPFATSGRGLMLVDSLATQWGVTVSDGDLGKAVWFEVSR